MARFSKDSVDRVKEAADIVEVVSAYTDLRQRGKDWWGLCPFHDESTPSFKVDPLDKLYYCFGCEASGDVFSFVEEKEGLSFPEAVESLAERYGVELERETEDPQAEAARRQRARLYELLERTAAVLRQVPVGGEKREAVKARDYLAERGLEEEALRSFGVGLAPNRWDQVLVGGQRAGFKVEELFDAGLLRRNKRGALRPLPPADHVPDPRPARTGAGVRGAGAAARREGEVRELARGRPLPQERTALRDRPGPPAIAKAKRAIVVEGYTDVIALHQAGIDRGGGDHGHGDHARTAEDARRPDGVGGAGARR